MKFSKAEVDAIIEASPRTFVPFNKLVLSEDHQARSATAPVMSLPELAASIKDSGVLQNLVVVQAARGRYDAYFSPSWTPFQADGGRDFSVIVDGVSV